MPTYVYRFVDTGETIEVQQSFSEPTLTEAVHPVTGDVKAVKKVFLPVGVTFKGSGFYKTDSRSGAGAKGASKLPAGNGDGSGAAASGESSTASSGTNGSSGSSGSDGSSSSASSGSSGSSTGSGDHGHSHSHSHSH
jgi:predicted nucleic acid-binding Zn ribbon protein